jgi:hypothetical protein
MQDVLIEQMLVGMLFLAPLLATLPTTWLLHAVTTVLHIVLLFSRCIIHAATAVLEMGCIYDFVAWAGQHWWGSASLGGELDVRFLGSDTASIVDRGKRVTNKTCAVAYFWISSSNVPLASALKPTVEYIAREMHLLANVLT